jgi:hypothetical protein
MLVQVTWDAGRHEIDLPLSCTLGAFCDLVKKVLNIAGDVRLADFNDGMLSMVVNESTLVDGCIHVCFDGLATVPDTKAQTSSSAQAIQPAVPKRNPRPQKQVSLTDRQAAMDLSCILENFLFVGGQSSSSSRALLQQNGITHVLNCCDRIKCRFTKSVKYKVLHVHDTKSSNVRAHFEDAIDFMDAARESGGCVLVHCLVGASRSVTIALAYLITRCGMCLEDAFKLCRSRRKVARPNRAFAMQLIAYETALQGKSSTASMNTFGY